MHLTCNIGFLIYITREINQCIQIVYIKVNIH